MKKLFFVFLIPLCMTSCLSALLGGINKIAEEAQEIAEGKCFTVETGTVTYEDGTVVTFKEFGKTWASLEGDERIVVKDGIYYVVDEEEKTYYAEYSDEDLYSGCPYIFWESAYEWGDKIPGTELTKSTETIAGKKCTVFSTSEGSKIGGWERILFLSVDSEDSEDMRAKTWNAKADEALFSLEGYEPMMID